jgi:hypothetical protein
VPNAYYVYAIVRRDTPLPTARSGNATGDLTMVAWRELAAVTRWMGTDVAPLTTGAMLHHEAVVEAVRAQGPALPVRFGTMFSDATSVATAIEERYEALAADLHRLGDNVELGLTALWAAPPSSEESAFGSADDTPITQGAGARYLRAGVARLRRDEAVRERARVVAHQLDHVLGGWALDRRVSLLPTPRIAVRAAYLLDPAGVDAFRAVFDAMRRDRCDVRLLLTGPWPPYSFVRRTRREGGAPDGRFAELTEILAQATRGHLG